VPWSREFQFPAAANAAVILQRWAAPENRGGRFSATDAAFPHFVAVQALAVAAASSSFVARDFMPRTAI